MNETTNGTSDVPEVNAAEVEASTPNTPVHEGTVGNDSSILSMLDHTPALPTPGFLNAILEGNDLSLNSIEDPGNPTPETTETPAAPITTNNNNNDDHHLEDDEGDQHHHESDDEDEGEVVPTNPTDEPAAPTTHDNVDQHHEDDHENEDEDEGEVVPTSPTKEPAAPTTTTNNVEDDDHHEEEDEGEVVPPSPTNEPDAATTTNNNDEEEGEGEVVPPSPTNEPEPSPEPAAATATASSTTFPPAYDLSGIPSNPEIFTKLIEHAAQLPTEELYTLTEDIVKILKEWQDEWIQLEKEVVEEKNKNNLDNHLNNFASRLHLLIPRNPQKEDPVAVEDRKEADLYQFRYDSKGTKRGNQNPLISKGKRRRI
ncbi:MAG: hypothetical protein M1823_004218 [Watsoniomyces obsoletus]|nr:MAG: hypothetical protein M1823_004218 [Watsoniomyces obsoletus]